LIRDLHGRLARDYAEAGPAEILDHLAWEVGGAAGELVHPAKWVGNALVATGISANRSEAHGRVARVTWSRCGTDEETDAALPREVGPRGPLPDETACPDSRRDAIARMESDMADLTMPLHARLESCSLAELDQAAVTMLELALDHGDVAVVDDVVVSLIVFSGDKGHGRWWDATFAGGDRGDDRHQRERNTSR